jgi:hypothetical protein
MAKHRKTRKEKIRSDHRQEPVFATPPDTATPSQKKSAFTFTFSQKKIDQTTQSTTTRASNPNEYEFVKHDLIKTSIVVGSIVTAQLLLFVLIR